MISYSFYRPVAVTKMGDFYRQKSVSVFAEAKQKIPAPVSLVQLN